MEKQVYHSIADEREDLTISGCWSHARRGFADVVKAAGKKALNIRESVAYKSLQLIQTMSRCEEKFAKLDPAERLEFHPASFEVIEHHVEVSLDDHGNGTVPEPCIRPYEAKTSGVSCDACG